MESPDSELGWDLSQMGWTRMGLLRGSKMGSPQVGSFI